MVKEVDQLPSTTTTTVAAAAAGGNKYVHETIKKIAIAIFDDEQDEYDYDFMHMVDDPLEQTTVAIMIAINRYIDDDVHSTIERSYDLKGFLKDDTPNELDDLLSDKTVTARTLEKIKKTLLKSRNGIKKVALELSYEKIIVNMTLDLLTSYSDHKEDLKVEDDDDDDVEEEADDDDDDVEEEADDDDYDEDEEMFETDDEEMNGETFDEYDNVMSWKPALRSSVEALETRTLKNKEDFEMMLKISNCGNKSCDSCRVCMEEFSFDAAAGGTITIRMMPCSHIFHSECIVQWLEKKHTCPTCRYEMPTADH